MKQTQIFLFSFILVSIFSIASCGSDATEQEQGATEQKHSGSKSPTYEKCTATKKCPDNYFCYRSREEKDATEGLCYRACESNDQCPGIGSQGLGGCYSLSTPGKMGLKDVVLGTGYESLKGCYTGFGHPVHKVVSAEVD